MSRTKKSAETTISEALDTPIEMLVERAAEDLDISPLRLQELFVERLGSEEPMTWLTIPLHREPLLAEIKRSLESEASVRKFDVPTEPATPPQSEELPVIQDEPKPKRGKGGKLTQKKTEAIDKGRKASTAVSQGVDTVVIKAQLQKGLQTGSIAGTAYLTGFQSALTNTKAQGLTVLAAEMLQELNNTADISLEDILTEAGVALSADTQLDLNNRMGAMLGKLETATTEILETGWGNGYSLDAEMEKLTELLNLND